MSLPAVNKSILTGKSEVGYGVAAGEKKGVIPSIRSDGESRFKLVPIGIGIGQTEAGNEVAAGGKKKAVTLNNPSDGHSHRLVFSGRGSGQTVPGNEGAADKKKNGVILNVPSDSHSTFKLVPIGRGIEKTDAGSEVAADGKRKGDSTFKLVPIGRGTGHTHAVNAVAVDRRKKEVIINIPSDSQSRRPFKLVPIGRGHIHAVTGPSVVAPAATSRVGIIKSIVYGGLVESIASLSVVSSAAGADTATLNILALGMANMIGGFSALAQNLRVLKHETSSEKYEEALGEPGHFTLHVTVSVLCYILFGSLPPVVYAFTFRESDVRDYKMIAVAVTSLLSIVLLSAGKAYVRRGTEKEYLKTVSYFVSLGVMASGVSFVVGDLLDRLIEKLGLFNSSSSNSVKAAAWASY